MDILEPILNAPLYLSTENQVWITCSFVICQILYLVSDWYWSNKDYYKALPHIEQIEWQSRIVSTVHASIVFPLVVYILLSDAEFSVNPATSRNPIGDFTMCLSVGYFLSDLILILRHRIPPLLPLILHHVFAGWAFIMAIGPKGGARWFGTYLLLTEATAPWNNTHWALSRTSMKDHHITRYVGYLFVLTWIVFRLLIKPYALYQFFYSWNAIVETGIHVSVVLTINIGFLLLLNIGYFITGPFYDLAFGIKPKPVENQSSTEEVRKSNVK